MSSAYALHQGSDSRWTILNGPLKGSVQTLSNKSIVIGRSSDCDIAIVDDPKCSRQHAQVEWTSAGFEIQVLSSNNALKINGVSVDKKLLKDKDVVCVGETEIPADDSSAA